MPDTRRSKSALQTLHADNTAGDISAQDNRDGWESCHPEAVCQAAAIASEPSSGQLTGDLFFPSDAPFMERYSGSAWIPFGPMLQMTKPINGDFSWVNQGGASVSTSTGGILLSLPADTTNNLRCRVKTAPSTPYTITAMLAYNFAKVIDVNDYVLGGLMFRQSSDGKIQHFGMECSTAPLNYTGKWTNATTFSATYATQLSGTPLTSNLNFLRISDDGTNRKCFFSSDGLDWILFHSVGRTDFLTADQVGFFGWSNNADVASVRLYSWKEE